jgi:hypothetical protein
VDYASLPGAPAGSSGIQNPAIALNHLRVSLLQALIRVNDTQCVFGVGIGIGIEKPMPTPMSGMLNK